MSDPMTNMQIEDVLSSIRRLVSEDGRPAPRASAAPKLPEKLVLTPALRIVPGNAPKATPAAPEIAALDVAAQDTAISFDHLSHRAAAVVLEAALSGRPDDWEPDGSEVTRGGVDDWTVEWEAPSDALPEFVSARALPPEPAPAAPPEAALPGDAATAPADQPAAAETEARLHLLDEGDAPLIDEEMLRDIIRDVLREELQGAMGERITRNVRKLVRAEVARALTAREFD